MKLDADTVDIIFARLAAVYGAKFTNQWPAGALPTIKAAWMDELREFAGNSDAIEYGLGKLPTDHAVMVLELRDLCRTHVRMVNAARTSRIAPQTQEEREHALAVLASFRRPGAQHSKDWARKLRLRELSGERLSRFQRECWRTALGSAGECSPSYEDEPI